MNKTFIVTDVPGEKKNKLRVGDGVKRYLRQNHPVDIRNLEIENQPSRQRTRYIKRQLMKKFKSNEKSDNRRNSKGSIR